MLYTRKGDSGTTSVFNSKKGERISKSSCQTEALGSLDELNSFLGLVKVKAAEVGWAINSGTDNPEFNKPAGIVNWIQNQLFIMQAEVAGAEQTIQSGVILKIENLIAIFEKELPPIKTFFISGGTELAALFDISRTMARKAERRVVKSIEEGSFSVGADTLAFINRLSSLLYVMARFSNYKAGIFEGSPWYNLNN